MKTPYKTHMPYQLYVFYSSESQVEMHFKEIDVEARALETGASAFRNSPSHFRRLQNKRRKAKERSILQKINNEGEYELEMPYFRKSANWDYF